MSLEYFGNGPGKSVIHRCDTHAIYLHKHNKIFRKQTATTVIQLAWSVAYGDFPPGTRYELLIKHQVYSSATRINSYRNAAPADRSIYFILIICSFKVFE